VVGFGVFADWFWDWLDGVWFWGVG